MVNDGAEGRNKINQILDRLAHRGPDGRGTVVVGSAAHGHVRLALLDLTDAAAQPFKAGSSVLTFVGEIWNWRDIRAELEEVGATFSTQSDTEVLANALDLWGIAETMPRLDGMFAFAWSGSDGDWLARDRFGKVPLYVTRRGKTFEWASERKAWSDNGARATPLMPGSMLNLRTGDVVRPTQRANAHANDDADVEGIADDVFNLVRTGVRKRLFADAPVCVLASGGLDSSLILRLAVEERRDVAAFHAYLDPGSEDLACARRLCRELGVPLTEVLVPSPTLRLLTEAVRCTELSSKVQAELACLCIPLAKEIARCGYKACLSGEGADEIFGGYGNTEIASRAMDDLEWRIHRQGLVQRMARANFVRCNKSFMSGGVECRLPFMERGLVDLALSLGKRGCPAGKDLLKAAAVRVLPTWITGRQKDTFQGASGLQAAVESSVGNAAAFCRRIVNETYGGTTEA